ncbi:helix-turn-helix domain-containing protein [Streptomyces sp. NPDC020965]|uniref:nSTAND1 domain-containing NTPase n=1 Tax=Streptomyces sp. NPDC020965 TaxID=3365105 RepID=UPI0037AD5C0B
MAGRREVPVDPGAGPVQRFAYELRKLRRDAGGLTYRAMARQAGYSVTTLSRAAGGEQLPSLPVALAYAVACGGDEGEWEARWRTAVEESAVEQAEGEECTDPPYRGLARFEPGDRGHFFGRDQLVDDLLALVHSRRMVAIVGGSGSGKSSLLRAGLIPRLQEGDLLPAAIRILTPGEHPARTHGDVFTPSEAPGDTIVIVDQFEEAFTLCTDPAERARFIGLLLGALAPESRLRVVIGVRADFYGRCAEHRPLADALRGTGLLVGPMTRAELREAITRPAKAHGLTVERELTARIIDEIADEPGALPLMSHALLETWRRRRARTLTLDAYEATGGVQGAVATTAEATFAGLSAEQARLTRRILLRLITPGDGAADTRRPIDRRELDTPRSDERREPDAQPAGDTALVLERLAAARLITLDQGSIDLTHEALITAWPRLRTWIDTDRQRLRVHRNLTEAARAWDDLGRDSGALYRGLRLAEAREAFRALDRLAELTQLEQDFLVASRAGRTNERRRRNVLTSAICLLLALTLLAGVTAWQRSQAGEQRLAEATSRRIASLADTMRYDDPRTAMRLSVAAWRIHPTLEARAALHGSLSQREHDSVSLPRSRVESQVHLSFDGRKAAVIDAGDKAHVWDLENREPDQTVQLAHGEELVPIPFVPPHLLTRVDDRWHLRNIVSGSVHPLPFGPTETFNIVGSNGTVFLSAARDSVSVWDVRKPRRLFHRAIPVRRAMLSADARIAAFCTTSDQLEVWDVRLNRRIPTPEAAALSRLACDTQGTGIQIESQARRLIITAEEQIRIWELDRGRALRPIPVTRMNPSDVSDDGRFIVTANEQELAVWRVDRQEAPVYRYALKGGTLGELTLDPEGKVVRYIEPHPTSTVRTLSLGNALDPAWHPREHETPPARPPLPTAVTEDGSPVVAGPKGSGRLAQGNRTGWVTILDADHQPLASFAATSTATGAPEPEGVRALAYSPDGRILVSGGSTGTVRLWDTASNRPLGGPLLTSGDSVVSLSFSKDGKTLTVDGDHTPPRTYPVDPDRVADAVCERSGGGLHADEWKQHISNLPHRKTC